jgi:hypothetical protein
MPIDPVADHRNERAATGVMTERVSSKAATTVAACFMGRSSQGLTSERAPTEARSSPGVCTQGVVSLDPCSG